jgi:hypothetical protein
MLQDKIEAVYELKRYAGRKVKRDDDRLQTLLATLLKHTMNENRRLVVHVLEVQMQAEERQRLLDNCPTLARWVRQ